MAVSSARAALAFTLLETGLSSLFDHWRLIFGPLLILAVIFLPDGITGGWRRRRSHA